MNYIYIGDVVNTHGLKGEVRILSDFKYKEDVFKKGVKLYIGHDMDCLIINTYRRHKTYDMVTFDGINDINDVIGYKGDKVYIDKNETKISGILDEELIDLDVYDNDKYIGKVLSIIKNGIQDVIVIKDGDKKYMVPNVSEFVKNIDVDNKKIIISSIKGLLDDEN